jgi:hypothetical protein
MRIKAKIDGRDAVMRRLRQLVPAAEKELAIAQLEGAQELANRIKPRAPGSGRYRASIQADRLSNRPGKSALSKGLKGQTKDPNATGIFADFIWRLLEFGTKAHVIEPKTGEYLVFRGPDGNVVSTKKVDHPGAVAHPHIFPTFRAFRKRLRRKMAGAVNKAVRKVRRG